MVFFKKMKALILFYFKNLIQWNKILEENRCKFYECEVQVYEKHEISLICSNYYLHHIIDIIHLFWQEFII